MEDFYIDYLPGIKFNNENIKNAIKVLQENLESIIKINFHCLCAIREIVKNSTHGNLIITGDVCYLKYSSVSGEYTVFQIFKKMFGFCDKYVERLVRIINKFIIQDAGVLKYNIDNLKDFTISKLQELLPLSLEEIKKAFDKKYLTYKSTKSEIREYVKSLKDGDNKADKVLETNESEDDFEITDCGQYIKFNADNFEYLKKIIKGKKYNYKDTSEVINAVLEHCREQSLFL